MRVLQDPVSTPASGIIPTTMNASLRIISDKVERIASGQTDDLLLTLPSGHVVLNERQPEPITGCCILLPDPVPSAINDLHEDARRQFFADMAAIGDALLAVTGAERINYLVLCNQAPELHAHCIPRFASEDLELRRQGPFEAYDFAQAVPLDVAGAHRELHSQLRAELQRLVAAS